MNGLLALTSAKHSPGVTTAAMAFALAAGPRPASLVVEADPAGGDLGARCELALEPGLGSLAASGRHGAPLHLDAHVQALPVGGFGLLAPTSPVLATGALSSLGRRLGDALASWDGTVVVDCGRWRPDSPAATLAAGADALLVVLRPTLDGVEHVRVRLDDLRAAGAATLGAVLVGDRPYSATEVAISLGIPVVGVLPIDARGARALERRVLGATTLHRNVLRAARTALDTMSRWSVDRAEVRT